MANHKSALKRVRQNEKRRIRNRHIVATMRTYIKAVRSAISNEDADAARAALPTAVNALNAAVTKGVIHRNQASRKISRLTKAVNALEG